MSIDYQILADRKILVATASGPITPADNDRSNHRVKAELERHPGLKLMVDMRAAEVAATPVAMIGMMDAFFGLVGHQMPVAIITARLPDNSNTMLAETKAFIAGARMRIFEVEDEAYAWLEQE